MRYTAADVSAIAVNKTSEILDHLLGPGETSGTNRFYGHIDGSKGRSLQISVTGKYAGRWVQRNPSESINGRDHGDLIDLWSGVKGTTIRESINEISKFLGLDQGEPKAARKQYKRPKAPKGTVPVEQNETCLKYLTDDRGLSIEQLRRYRVFATGQTIVFPYLKLVPERTTRRIKYLNVERPDGKKQMWGNKEPEPCLFGWQVVDPQDRSVIITEGEIDAISCGTTQPALSMPYGCGDLKWIDNDWDDLAVFDDIVLFLDADAAGQAKVDEIIKRLGIARCRLVSVPKGCKDANDCLLAGHDLQQLVDDAKAPAPTEVVRVDVLSERLEKLLTGEEDTSRNIALPWGKVSENVCLRPSELSLLCGMNGHGKSEIVSHMAIDAIDQGHSVCIASLEWRVEVYFKRMLRQAGCLPPDQMTPQFRRAVYDWFDEGLCMFDLTGTAKFNRVLGLMQFCYRRYGSNFFIIDNLAKLGVGEEDYQRQKDAVDALGDFANETDTHVLLVHHVRKMRDEFESPGKFDIKGSGSITDMSKTVMTLWRNKKKERAAEIPEEERTEAQEKLLLQSDAYLNVCKQNGGEWEGGVGLWFDSKSHQYIERDGGKPNNYVSYVQAVRAVE